MLEFLIALLLAGGAIWYVLHPILRPAFPAAAADTTGDEGEDPDDDLSPRAVALRALKEIEFDRATGKLADADYEALRAKYTAEALAALRGASRGSGQSEAATPPAARVPDLACAAHGPRPESGAEFCSICGRRLGGGAAFGYCTRCGGPLEADATFCGRCGIRVAA